MWSRAPDRYRGVPRAQAERIRLRDNRTCQNCGAPGYQVDHKTNVARGGTNDDENLWVLCDSCHAAKTKSEAAQGIARRSRHRPAEPHPGRLSPGG
ncbi:HNH endonuclease signature motif containing protein [Nocardia transvalensis]|uniref:HNH endonuclease n=1 Tax=Nocardia transvalensis TaxID=37333 RepID=UPI0018936D8C|nr:HNH endonuclease [Nocardia transvalensis]